MPSKRKSGDEHYATLQPVLAAVIVAGAYWFWFEITYLYHRLTWR